MKSSLLLLSFCMVLAFGGLSFGSAVCTEPLLSLPLSSLSSSLSSLPKTNLSLACSIPRGGAIFFNSDKHRRYMKLLQKDNVELEQKILMYQDRVAKLRQDYEVAHRAALNVRAQGGFKMKQELQEYKVLTQNLEKQLSSLQSSLEQMTDLKQQVETLLLAEQEKVRELQEKIVKAVNESSREAKERYQRELKQVRDEMEQRALQQLQTLRETMELQAIQQLQEAVAQAKAETQEKFQKQLQQVQSQQEQTLSRLKADFARQFKELETKYENELNIERRKRKKLLQSLTAREKQIALENLQLEQKQQRQQRQQERQRRVGTSSQNQPQTTVAAETIRPRF